ncbi:hypothetical protein KDK_32860 [Dictyobacter kobayashii]|uniref:Uncharacterized protein n=1 Tax=Dictyobacter kobayashii TaxID=2014872 RepID=A0A402AK47_9CHLR|nr:hypothetical protein [Dictyobacter kobayashii]GCE19486.1 hypothetical protein KDK_32860 [Dictyobacter kobayashii]
MVHFYELASLDEAQRARLMRRAEVAIDDLLEYVRPIVQAVRDRGMRRCWSSWSVLIM